MGSRSDQATPSSDVADYLEAVRDRAPLPPHAFPAGIFMDAFPASVYRAAATLPADTAAPLAPVAPIGQSTSLTVDGLKNERLLQTMPDIGRRVQLWWD